MPSKDFMTLGQDPTNHWGKTSHYLAFCTLLGSSDYFVSKALTGIYKLSGGMFVALLSVTTFFIAMPMMAVETFLGKYTKKVNGQMYMMAPLFVGMSIVHVMVNVIYIPLDSVHLSYYALDMVSIMANNTINSKCYFEDVNCYDYKIHGVMNESCTKIGKLVQCDINYNVKYPAHYNYWIWYIEENNLTKERWKYSGTLLIIWLLVLLLLFIRLRQLGYILMVVFWMHVASLGLVFAYALSEVGCVEGLSETFQVNLDKMPDLHHISSIILYSLRRIGLVQPFGHMTLSSRLEEDSGPGDFKIAFLSTSYLFYQILIYNAISGIICKQFTGKVDAARCNVHESYGTVLATVPEFLAYMKSPTIIIAFFYLSSFLKETFITTISMHMISHTLQEYFPTAERYESYVKVILMIILLMFAWIFANREYLSKVVVPAFHYSYLLLGTNIFLLIESIMIFYCYSINRLSEDITFWTGSRASALNRIIWFFLPFILLATLLFREATIRAKWAFFLFENPSETKLGRKFDYFFLGCLLTMVIFSLLNILASLGEVQICEKLIKPVFHWGPLDPEKRIERKRFFPNTTIRSQPIKTRKVMEARVAPTDHRQVEKEFTKDTDEIEKAVKGGEVQESDVKVGRREVAKGRIFGDSEFFMNLHCNQVVYIKALHKCESSSHK